MCTLRDCEVDFLVLTCLLFLLVFILLGTMTEEAEIPNSTIQMTLASIIKKLHAKDDQLGSIEGDANSLKEHQNSTFSTPQNYRASSNGHDQNTSTAISPKTLHQMFNPPRKYMILPSKLLLTQIS